MNNDRLRFGVLGCADIAWRRTLPALAAERRVHLVAVASRDPAKAQRFADRFGCEAVEGYRPLLTRDDIDAVYVPLPAGLHAHWTREALRHGKHVLCEKPLTTDADTSAELVAQARDAGLLLMENYMFVHHSQHTAVRRLIDDGAIGEPRKFYGAFTIPRLPAGDIRHRADLGGGALLDVGGYPLRAASLFLGPRLKVIGAFLRHDPDTTVDLEGAALLRSPAGVTAQISFGIDNAYRSAYELSGTEGRISLERAFTPPADHAPVLRIERAGRTQEVTLPPDDQFAAVAGAFTGTALSGTGFTSHAEDILRQAGLQSEVRRQAMDARTAEGR
ncbi:Gfo/Idh/MocA family protein [Actinoallomurus sp. CA-150999]|uniref:Gfo/Idh/MocA family protein n=1 Tax=Actinoallomurus sp. CA-150999 TaxID=3239887 RepID=UPI003D90D6CB